MLLLSGCIDPIDFTGNDEAPLLVVFGSLRIGDLPSELTIRRTQATGGPSAKITDAVVKIIDGNGAETSMTPDAQGIYRLSTFGGFELTEGVFYHAEITFPDGKTFLTEPQMMPPPPPPTEGIIDLQPRKADISARADFTATDTPLYVRAIYDEVYSFSEIFCGGLDPVLTCYFTETPALRRMPLFDNDGGQIRDTLNVKIFETRDFAARAKEFRGRHYFNFYLHSVPREAYVFWQNVNKISDAQGTVFDPAPAAVLGNVFEKDNPENRLLGYFETANVSVKRPFLRPSHFTEKDIFIPPFCPENTPPSLLDFGSFDRACCNCLRLEGGTLERPDWF